jgi:hypothetical protein
MKIKLLLILIFISSNSYAKKLIKQSKLTGEVELQSNSFKKSRSTFESDFININFNYNNDISDNYSQKLKLTGRFDRQKEALISLDEVYVNHKRENSELFIGRVLLNWSKVDKEWNLGFLNNRKNFSFYENDQQGLIGVKLNYKRKNIFLESFATYMYIPEVYPTIEIKDGQFFSRSFWSTLPPRYGVYNNIKLPIYYNLNKPKIKDVILRPSFGVFGRLNYLNTKFDSYLIYKPDNNFSVDLSSYYEIAKEQAYANLYPYVQNSLNFGSKISHKIDKQDFKLFFNSELLMYFPVKKFNSDNKSEYEITNISRSKSQFLSLNSKLEHKNHILSLDYLIKLKGIVDSNSDEGDNDITSSNDSRKWSKAFGLNYKGHYFDHLSMTTMLKYDLYYKDLLFTYELSYKLLNSFKISTGIKLISAPNDSTFWANFRGNDSFYSSFKYLF